MLLKFKLPDGSSFAIRADVIYGVEWRGQGASTLIFKVSTSPEKIDVCGTVEEVIRYVNGALRN